MPGINVVKSQRYAEYCEISGWSRNINKFKMSVASGSPLGSRWLPLYMVSWYACAPNNTRFETKAG